MILKSGQFSNDPNLDLEPDLSSTSISTNLTSGRQGIHFRFQRIWSCLIRLSLATGYWYFLTQWFWGPAIFERIYLLTGDCSRMSNDSKLQFKDFNLKGGLKDCHENGGNWSGMDISGHTFLLIHTSLFILEEVFLRYESWFFILNATQILSSPMIKESESTNHSPSLIKRETPPKLNSSTQTLLNQKKDFTSFTIPSPSLNSVPLIVNSNRNFFLVLEWAWMSYFIALFLLWNSMLIITILFFHSWDEKIIGLLFGLGFWTLFYGHSYSSHFGFRTQV